MVNWIKTVPEGLLPDDAGGWLNRICRRLMKRIPQFPHRAMAEFGDRLCIVA